MAFVLSVLLRFTAFDYPFGVFKVFYVLDIVQRNGLSSSNFHDVQRHFQQYFSYIVVVSFIGGGTGGPGENHRPVANVSLVSHSRDVLISIKQHYPVHL
jgi:hypothetical protein